MSTIRTGSGAFAFVFIAVLVDSIGFGIVLPVLPSLIMALAHVSVAKAAEYGGWLAFVSPRPVLRRGGHCVGQHRVRLFRPAGILAPGVAPPV
jgi:hypothetical protein